MEKSHKTGGRIKRVAEELYEGNISELARNLGMTPQTFNKYAQGETTPGAKVLQRFSGLGISLNWLLMGKGDMYGLTEGNPELSQLEENGLTNNAERIKWIRLFYKKTITDMASIMSVSPTRQLNIEKGGRKLWPEYIERIFKNFPDVREAWLKEGEEPKLHSYPTEEARKQSGNEIANHLAALENRAHSPAEHELLKEVKNFARLLESPNLHHQVKGILIDLLIQHIDRELERRQHAQAQPSGD